MMTKMNMQDQILSIARKENVPVLLHLVNGFQIRGQVSAFDNFVVVIDSVEGKQMMIYKHAISTISPQRPIAISVEEA